MSTRRADSPVYVLGILLALAGGWLQIKVHDLLFTALLVVASTMVLGATRPRKPWRWAILFPVLVPLTQLVARFVLVEKSTRAEVYESLLLFLPGIAGAYGGAVLRQTLQRVWSGK
jgi:ABC-type multidrug transport system permease subunit